MDINSLPLDTGIKVLQWCKKNNLTPKKIGELLELLDKKPTPPTKAKRAERPKVEAPPKRDYKKLRNDTGKSQEEVVTEADINIQTLRQIENGKGHPRRATLAKLDKYYEVE